MTMRSNRSFARSGKNRKMPALRVCRGRTGAEVQEPPVRDGRFFRPGQVFTLPLTGRSPSTVGDKKGGNAPSAETGSETD